MRTFYFLLAPALAFAVTFGPPPQSGGTHDRRQSSNNLLDVNAAGKPFIWLPDDVHAGKTFYDSYNFFSYDDPTNGNVNYQSANDSWAKGLVYIEEDGTVIMRADSWTTLEKGAFRDSVRLGSKKVYNGGLFILDVDRAPWGCATWPAFWTVGLETPGNEAETRWPGNGEIDILEGVHDNQHNQITWHTRRGCHLSPQISNFTGTPVAKPAENGTVSCYWEDNGNGGCGVTEWSRASYGAYFNENHGGVFAMKWDEDGISVWSFFRAAVPADITEGRPNPSTWLAPSASLASSGCDPFSFFANHSIIFDITFCGNWAGNVETPGCPGTCADVIADPKNFVNATWAINSVKTYKKQAIGTVTDPNASKGSRLDSPRILTLALLVVGGALASA